MENGGRGGRREGAGRKPKSDELELIEKLRPLDELAFKTLKELITAGDQAALKLFMSYRYGQPRQTIDANIAGDLSIIWQEEKTYVPLNEINN